MIDTARRAATLCLCGIVVPVLLLLVSPNARAQSSHAGDNRIDIKPVPGGEFKLTFGRYLASGQSGGSADGTDLNLRYRADTSTWWGGVYRDPGFGGQARAGYDTRWQPWEAHDFAILPAVMAASRGFIGGSLALEAGAPFFVQAGIGRTNLKPFANLNFDPNDAVTLAAGYRGDSGASYAASIIRDDRTGTGQRHIHLTGQWELGDQQRLTLDVLHKSGQGDTGYVSANGVAATYDWPRWFGRVAYDPKQNFGAVNVTRLSVGTRF